MSRTSSLLAFLTGLLVFAQAEDADAAPRRRVAGAQGKRLRFHAETDFFGWTHINPDGNNDNRNAVGFGFGRATGPDASVGIPSYSLGIGGVLLDSRIVVGAKVSFIVNTSKADDAASGPDDDDDRTTQVGGMLLPYFRWVFLPGRRVRPYLEAHFGFAGSTTILSEEESENGSSVSTIHPIVGPAGGIHVFVVEGFSFDFGLGFDYWAPHARSETRIGDAEVEDDFSKTADVVNLAVQAGFSAWF